MFGIPAGEKHRAGRQTGIVQILTFLFGQIKMGGADAERRNFDRAISVLLLDITFIVCGQHRLEHGG